MSCVFKQGKAESEPQLGFPFPLWELYNQVYETVPEPGVASGRDFVLHKQYKAYIKKK